jgi:phosphoribosylformylglycinamidine synthase
LAVLHLIELMTRLALGREREGAKVIKGTTPELDGLGISHVWIIQNFVCIGKLSTETYPYNPNGSPQGITSVTTPDGRFTVLMPHAERVFRTVQQSYSSERLKQEQAREASPWLRMFNNARVWVG